MFAGPIVNEIGRLGNLKYLVLANNSLSGSLPNKLCNHNLKYLGLDKNMLDGVIPSDLGRCSQLEELWLSSNYLNGPVPSEIGNLTRLVGIYLSNNLLTGMFPTFSVNVFWLVIVTTLTSGHPRKNSYIDNNHYLYIKSTHNCLSTD